MGERLPGPTGIPLGPPLTPPRTRAPALGPEREPFLLRGPGPRSSSLLHGSPAAGTGDGTSVNRATVSNWTGLSSRAAGLTSSVKSSPESRPAGVREAGESSGPAETGLRRPNRRDSLRPLPAAPRGRLLSPRLHPRQRSCPRAQLGEEGPEGAEATEAEGAARPPPHRGLGRKVEEGNSSLSWCLRVKKT